MAEFKTTDFMGFMAVDNVTGFKGTVTAFCFYMHGSAQLQLTHITKGEEKWFDISRIVVTKAKMIHEVVDADTGEVELFDVNKERSQKRKVDIEEA